MGEPQKKILVVDDEDGLRDLMKAMLSQRGYAVDTAADGEECLKKAGNAHPDIILLDVTMPKLNGWQTLSRLRNDPATGSIPVVMLTGRADTESLMKSEEQHVVDYFIKPIVIEELLAFLKRFFELKDIEGRS